MRPHKQSQQGSVIVSILITTLFLTTLIFALLVLANSNLVRAKQRIYLLQAQYSAESGADSAIATLNGGNTSYTGTGGSDLTVIATTGYKSTFSTVVSAGSNSLEKIVTSTGKVYVPASATQPSFTRKVSITVTGKQGSGYAVIGGVGGLILSNNAIIGGVVYTNGKITMSNNSIIGSATNPATVSAAYYNCPSPADSTYPRACTSGEPISLTNSAHIYGSVSANNQTTGTGMTNSGLVASSGVPYLALPSYGRAPQKAAVATTITAAAASCSSGSKTWSANTHITGGNVLINNSCTLTVQGDVWIDGNFTIQNNGNMKVDNAMTRAPVIMIDGSAGGKFDNNSVITSNAAGWGFKFITFYSKAACSPDCTTVTGADLANSQGVQTLTMQNSGLGANTLFYARWSKVFVNNNGSVGGINGQTIQLQNNGNITFGYSVGGDGATTWYAKYYQVTH